MFSPLLQIDIGYMYKIYTRFPPLSIEDEQARVVEEKGGCGEEGRGNREVGHLKANPIIWMEMSP